MVRIICTALIVTAFDLVLDPGAVRLRFWHYAGGAEFYGVPVSNFVGWLVSGAVGAVLIEIFTRLTKPLLPIAIGRKKTALSRTKYARFLYVSRTKSQNRVPTRSLVKWKDFLITAGEINTGISPWAIEEAGLLAENVKFERLFALNRAATADE